VTLHSNGKGLPMATVTDSWVIVMWGWQQRILGVQNCESNLGPRYHADKLQGIIMFVPEDAIRYFISLQIAP
jgi:hypothetical protein